MNKPSIVVVGSSNTDMIAKMKQLPRAGETVLGDEFLTEPGGKGANQAVAAARAGAGVSLVARVGRDALGEQAIAAYTADGIDVTYVTRDRHRPSGAALIFVAADGANSIAVASGANGALSPSHVMKAASMIGNAKVLLLQLEIPIETVNAAARVAVAKGVRVILNPAPARRLSRQLLRQVSILTPNESEAELLTGIRLRNLASAEQAARKLVRLGARTVILTLGAKGALIASDGETELVPGFKVRAIDTTAAGDVFNGMLAVAVAEERPLIEAVRMANAAAALSVQRSGSQASAPSRRAINAFLRSQAGAHSPRSTERRLR